MTKKIKGDYDTAKYNIEHALLDAGFKWLIKSNYMIHIPSNTVLFIDGREVFVLKPCRKGSKHRYKLI
jgi:hypothetical protein